jgi:hypothetical protein
MQVCRTKGRDRSFNIFDGRGICDARAAQEQRPLAGKSDVYGGATHAQRNAVIANLPQDAERGGALQHLQHM